MFVLKPTMRHIHDNTSKEKPADRNFRELSAVAIFAANLHCRCKRKGRCKVCVARRVILRTEIANEV